MYHKIMISQNNGVIAKLQLSKIKFSGKILKEVIIQIVIYINSLFVMSLFVLLFRHWIDDEYTTKKGSPIKSGGDGGGLICFYRIKFQLKSKIRIIIIIIIFSL